jgi:hypothetical protein
MGWVGNATPRPLYYRERDPVPTVYEAGWATGLVWKGAENLAPAGIGFPDRPARRQSLYLLSYPNPVPTFITSLKPNSCTALTTQNTKENNCIISHAQNTKVLQLNGFLKCNTSVTGHKQETAGFPQRKSLPRSTGNSSVTDSIYHLPLVTTCYALFI